MTSYQIKFPLSSSPGAKPAMGQGRLINAYATIENGMQLWKRVPGLLHFLSQDKGKIRGLHWFENLKQLMIVAGDKVGFYSGSGDIDWRNGTVEGTGPVCISRNNNAETDIVITTNSQYTYVVKATGVEQYPDGNVGVPNSVCFLDAFFCFTYPDGVIKISDVNKTDIPPLSFTKAQSSPDGLLRGVASRSFFYAMGSASIEIYQNIGALDFPFQRVRVLETGLYGPWSVAGASVEGWDNPIFFVASDGTVRALQDYQTSIISSENVTRSIRTVSRKEDIHCFVYMFEDNPMFVITSPKFTWEYNVKTKQWNERKSYYDNLGDNWRADTPVLAFEKWLIADKDTGTLYQIDSETLKEGLAPLVFILESEVMTGFPQKIACRRTDFDFIVGYGEERGLDPIEIDPTVTISWSLDGGVSYCVPIERKLGREGRYSNLVSILGLGLSGAQGWRFRIKISDPIECSLKGAFMNSEARLV